MRWQPMPMANYSSQYGHLIEWVQDGQYEYGNHELLSIPRRAHTYSDGEHGEEVPKNALV